MLPRSRIRGRDPPPSGGRYRRRSPAPPSPRHQRRPRDPPYPQPKRRSSELPPPRRYDENPLPSGFAAAAERRSRGDILLEAGRLAAHYLVAEGLLPEHVLLSREDPNHNHSYRPEPPVPVPAPVPAPAPSSYGRKRDEDDGPRWRRSGSGAGDLDRGSKWDDNREAKRSGWDRRSHSFDERRKYNDGGDVDRGGRRTRDYNELKRPPMSRSYSHNDRRALADGTVDRRRRSRSRSRTRGYYTGSRRDPDLRAGTRDLDRTKVTDSGAVPAAGGDGGMHNVDANEIPRQPKVPGSVVVSETDDSAVEAVAIEDKQMESDTAGLDHAQDMSEGEDSEFAEDISEDEDGEFAGSDLNDEDGDEMDNTQSQLSDVHVHTSESVEELDLRQSQLSNAEEGMETCIAHVYACMVEPLAENNVCSETRYEMEEPQNGSETAVGDLYSDEQEQPLTEYNGCSEVKCEMEAARSEFETGVDNLDRDEQERLLAENNSCSEVRYGMEAPQCEVETGVGGLNRDDKEQPLVVTNDYSELRYETTASQTEVETVVGDLSRDEQELPAWYKIFDLNVIETPVGCEFSEISRSPPADDLCDSVPDLIGLVNQQENNDTSEIHGQDDRAGANQMLEDESNLDNYDLNNEADEHARDDTSVNQVQDENAEDNHLPEDGHGLMKYDMNIEAGEPAHDNHQMNNAEIHLNHSMVAHISDNCHMNNEKMLLKQNVDEQQMENEQMLIDQVTTVHVLDSHHVNHEQLLLGHSVDDHDQMEPNPMALGVHNLDNYYLSSKQVLLNNDADQHAGDIHHLKDGQIILDEAADGQARVNGQTIHVIDLEEDYAQQSESRNTGEYLESTGTSHKYTDNVLQEHMCSQD
ncbi:uncharacterized protein [Zea mays]|uniref:Uncharacterized protein n=1 Tax=Zea mays TaxID=4577 RepID=A0A804PDK2_MAIZE|nr:uncharacterized protein LOC103626447 isoform X2 [Zea mays]|eukprot:XP_008645081.1 uncharacterized protein LOC103626447 isoform X2 [Zea mays]